MTEAYDALPDEKKDMLSRLKAVHDMGDFRNNFTINEADGSRLDTAMQTFGCAIHDIIKTHPITGKNSCMSTMGLPLIPSAKVRGK